MQLETQKLQKKIWGEGTAGIPHPHTPCTAI